MNAPRRALRDQYARTLQDYLAATGETNLHRAYELGRRALDEGLGVLEMASLHHHALATVAAGVRAPEERRTILEAAGNFFAEALSPFEMAHRGFQEANVALRQSEARYRSLVESAQDVIYTLSAEGAITSLNPCFETITGWSLADWMGKPFPPLVHPDDLPAALEFFQRVLRGETPPLFELRVRAKSGAYIPGEFTQTPLVKDGQVVGVLGIGRDITERKRAEEALRVSEERFRSIAQSASDAIISADDSGNIVSWNNGARTIFGYGESEVLGKPLTVLMPERYREAHRKGLARMRAGGGARMVGTTVELHGLRKDGTEFPVELALSMWKGIEGLFYSGIIRDITDRKRAEEALRRLNQTLEDEAKRIAHALHDEAGQLLASVYIALEGIARDLPLSARRRLKEVKALLDQIEVQLRRLSHELRPTILDDLGLVPALEFLSEGVSKRTKLQVTVAGSTLGRLAAPVETALYRIVQEAMNNVTRHAKARCATVRLEQNGRFIRCLVCDDGIGFDVPAVLSRKGHTGLGLIGIRERLNAVGGKYRIISAPGQGTTLQVEIPLEAHDVTQDSVSR